MKTIYIAGPMSGLPEYNHPAFYAAEKELVASGEYQEVINPARNKVEHIGTEKEIWTAYMRISIAQVARSDAIYLLKGWRNSSGATVEKAIADTLGLEIIEK